MKTEVVLIGLALLTTGGGLGYLLAAFAARGWLWALWIGCALGCALFWAMAEAAPGWDGLWPAFLAVCVALFGIAAVPGGLIGLRTRRRAE